MGEEVRSGPSRRSGYLTWRERISGKPLLITLLDAGRMKRLRSGVPWSCCVFFLDGLGYRCGTLREPKCMFQLASPESDRHSEIVKRWHSILLLAVLFAGGALAYLHRQELGNAASFLLGSNRDGGRTASAHQPVSIIWETVARSGDGFTVEMPVHSKEVRVSSYNQAGGAEPVRMITANPDIQTSYSVAWADDPPVVRVNGRTPDRILDMARDEELARTKTMLLTEVRGTPGGRPARDIVVQNTSGGVMDSRLILSGGRLYMLIASFPSLGARREQDVIRFYNSFKETETGKSESVAARKRRNS